MEHGIEGCGCESKDRQTRERLAKTQVTCRVVKHALKVLKKDHTKYIGGLNGNRLKHKRTRTNAHEPKNAMRRAHMCHLSYFVRIGTCAHVALLDKYEQSPGIPADASCVTVTFQSHTHGPAAVRASTRVPTNLVGWLVTIRKLPMLD